MALARDQGKICSNVKAADPTLIFRLRAEVSIRFKLGKYILLLIFFICPLSGLILARRTEATK
jgi:hypothetical protein